MRRRIDAAHEVAGFAAFGWRSESLPD